MIPSWNLFYLFLKGRSKMNPVLPLVVLLLLSLLPQLSKHPFKRMNDDRHYNLGVGLVTLSAASIILILYWPHSWFLAFILYAIAGLDIWFYYCP